MGAGLRTGTKVTGSPDGVVPPDPNDGAPVPDSTHREADDLGRAVEIAERISYLTKLWVPLLHINPFCLTTLH